MSNSVVNWFGNSFQELDPLIQKLHMENSELQGEVELAFGKGLAGFVGKRVAKKLGLPLTGGKKSLKVVISNRDGLLVWSRYFNTDIKMESVFRPIGSQPDGYWLEETGKLKMQLGVQVHEGGWYWQQQKVWLLNIPFPLWLFPSSHAYKKVVDGLYEFSVSISLPLLGKVVSYSGKLKSI